MTDRPPPKMPHGPEKPPSIGARAQSIAPNDKWGSFGPARFPGATIPNKNLEASKYGVDPNRHWGSYSIILASPRLHLRLPLAAESMIRSGHPWLFADSIREQNREGEPGELDRKSVV